MARLLIQETSEYYNWLFRIEAQEFEKELLEIVSSNQLPILHTISRCQIHFPKILDNPYNK